ncbi:12-oxophytodienoate reductase [Diaporthe eres]|nr:12-oxophytodienoate reductase [Diaporthe eres]
MPVIPTSPPEKKTTSVVINPTDLFNNSLVGFDEMKQVYTYLITELVSRRVGIINIGRRGAETKTETGEFFGKVQLPQGHLPPGYDPVLDFGRLVKFPGSPMLLMTNHDYTVEEAAELVEQQKLDLIAFGRPFIYNPDLITRIKHVIPFARNDRGSSVFYGPYDKVDENYNDWPAAVIQQGA